MNNEIYKAPIRKLMRVKISSGGLLLVTAFLAIVVVNSPLKDLYESLFSQTISLNIFGADLFTRNREEMTLAILINDALMALFFLSVGLEIKREILVGELSSPRKALLPVIAACGGMIIPIVIFTLIVPDGPAQRGAAIPMATDIAFSLGVLSLLGKRVPIALKIFLTAFAVVDDIGGIVVIALFYSSNISLSLLLASAVVLLIMWIGGRMGVISKLFYMCGFIVVWFLLFHSGISPTIAGVLAALTIPARPKLNLESFMNDIQSSLATLPRNQQRMRLLSNSELSTLKHIESISDRAISPLQSLDDNLSPIVNYFIMPIFAFANAGVSFEGFSFNSIGVLSIAIFCALVFGKTIGIFSFTWLAVKSRVSRMPKRVDFRQIFGVSILGGIGFTVSLFIATLSYIGADSVHLLNDAKMGIIFGSLFSGLLGYIVLRFVLKPAKKVAAF